MEPTYPGSDNCATIGAERQDAMDIDPPSSTSHDRSGEEALRVGEAGSPIGGTSDQVTPGPGSALPIGASSSDSDDEEDGANKASGSSKSPEEKLIKAINYKDRGNGCIAGDSAAALKHYERGIKIASSLPAEEQTKALLISLRLNLALACTKEERYADAASAASKVLDIESTNVKALFRRGVARSRQGILEGAKSDLLAVIKADPRNGGAKKELKTVRDRLVAHRQKEKESYGGLFDKGPMYNDKELERQKREAEAAKRLKEEEAEWRLVNVRRKAEGREDITLEDWRKEKKETEEKAKKEKEEAEKRKPKPSPPTSQLSPPARSSPKEGGGGEEMDLDEEDLKIIQDTKKQGYCYFKRTLSKTEQSLLDAEQMKLRARVSPSPPTTAKALESSVASEGTRSAWNEAGTWEEVDKSEWCKEKLTHALSKVTVSTGKDAASDPQYLMDKLGGFDFASMGADGAGGRGLEALDQLKRALAKLRASVTNVEIAGGDAHVICVSNKTKHIFDFNVKLKFSLTIDESMGLPPQAEGEEASKEPSSLKTYTGKLEFPDMTNSDVDNGRFDSEPELKWDKLSRWEAAYDDEVKRCIVELKAAILSSLGSFFDEFKGS